MSPGEKDVTMNTPLFSAVIPVYNYGRFAGKAIESVLEQNMGDFELIIVNDASTDNSDDVIQKYLRDKRIRYFINEKNAGCYYSLRRGFSEARGLYAASLSADDYYLPDAFSKLADAASAHPDADIIYGKYCFVNDDGQLTQWVRHPGWDPIVRAQRISDLADLLQYDLYVNITAAFVKLELFRKYEFDQKIRVSDYEFILQLAQDDRKLQFVDEYLFAFRKHGEQLSVGDNFYVDGTQLKDQLTLIERFVTPDNYAKLDGAQDGILRLLNQKIAALQNYPESAARILPELSERIENALKAISEIRHVPDIDIKKVKNPEVSVIVPTYNRPNLLSVALKSIAAQTFKDYEVIVINDSGCDVKDVIQESGIAEKINYISLGRNRERSFVRNCGLKLATGNYIAYLDDDDAYYPEHLQTLIDTIKNRQCRAAYADSYRAIQIIKNGKYETVRRELLYSVEFSIYDLFVGNLFPNLCVMHEKSLVNEIGYFDETLNTHEDWDYWIRIGLRSPFVHVKKVTSEYTFRDDGTNTTAYNRVDFFNTRQVIYKRYQPFSASYPQVALMQQAILRSESAEKVLTPDAFVMKLLQYVNLNQTSELIKFYDSNRGRFVNSEELKRVDDLIRNLKIKKIAST